MIAWVCRNREAAKELQRSLMGSGAHPQMYKILVLGDSLDYHRGCLFDHIQFVDVDDLIYPTRDTHGRSLTHKRWLDDLHTRLK